MDAAIGLDISSVVCTNPGFVVGVVAPKVV